ncbi:uncharacterized protein [Pseudorasbora parva]|uniref:uncharacterized protein n=1 Tax=Pseudorasbora parva TaxID=51549 RepID=UPI00351E2E86
MGASVSSDRNIVLLGKTGDGKSSAGNTILRKTCFTPDASPNSITDTSVRGKSKVYGQKITVIDTPGVLDTGRDDESIRSEIIRSIINCAAGLDAFVIVLKVERFTRQAEEVVDKISQICGEDIFQHAVVLFTHGEELEGQTIEEFVQQNQKLQEFVDQCGGRCHVIDNKYWRKCLHWPCSCGYKSNRVQVKNLLKTINEMVNRHGRYTNELLQSLERMIQEEMMNTNVDNASPNQQREQAERIVHDNLLMKVAGASAGTLTGALMGAGLCVALVVTSIKAGVAGANTAAAGVGTSAAGVGTSAAGVGTSAAGVGTSAAGVGTSAAGVGTSVAGVGTSAAGVGTSAAGVGTSAAGVGTSAAGVGTSAAGVGTSAAGVGTSAAGVGTSAAGVGTSAAGVGTSAAGVGTSAAGVGTSAAGVGTSAAGVGTSAAGVGTSVAGVGTSVFVAASLSGFIAGAATGWEAARVADSVSDAIQMGAAATYEYGKVVLEKAQKQVYFIFNPRI